MQARKQNAEIKVIGELPTPGNDGQQSTIPIFYDGRPHIFNFSEYAELARPCTSRPDRETNFGYPMIVDIADERNPKVVSKIFNEVTLPENCDAVAGDSAAFPSNGLTKGDIFGVVGSRVFLYDSHYCSTDRTHDPTIAACASFGSGIRVYDIRDPRAPTEIAYFNPGTTDSPAGAVANATVARPVIRSDLRQIWFADIAKGFYTVQFRDGVWPFRRPGPVPARGPLPPAVRPHLPRLPRVAQGGRSSCPARGACNTRRSLTVRLRQPAGGRITRVAVRVRGKRVKVLRGRRVRTQVHRPEAAEVGSLPRARRRHDVDRRARRRRSAATARACRGCARRRGARRSRRSCSPPGSTRRTSCTTAACSARGDGVSLGR